MISALYQNALECGIQPQDFWNYSLLEVQDLIRIFWQKKEKELKWKIAHDFAMLEAQARFTFREKGQDIPHPWEYYPDLFEEEAGRYKARKKQNQLEEYKEARRAYAAEFNRRRRQGT